MPQISEAEVFRACRTLSGPELQSNRDFLVQQKNLLTSYQQPQQRRRQDHPLYSKYYPGPQPSPATCHQPLQLP